MSKSILFINQSSGYLMIDIVNAHVPYYDNIILLTGYINPRDIPLDKKVKVIKLLKYNRTNSFKRFFTWTGFWAQSLYYVFLKYKNSNLYFVSNPPLNIFSARLTNRKFAFLVYDIFPEAFAKLNIMKRSSFHYKYWEKINHIAYKKAKALYTLSEGMKEAMKLNDVDKHKINVVPVWTNNTFFMEIPESKNHFLKKYNLKDKFVVCYSGNLGKSHPVERIIDIADRLRNEKNLLFLIIGEGDKKKQLLKIQKKKALPNLKILNFQPTQMFPHVLAAASIGVVTLESDAGDISVPSKTYNLMSASKPILTISKETSELAKIINKNKIGKNFSEHQIDKMCNYILELKDNPELYKITSQLSKKTSLKFTPENAKQMILK